MYTFVHTALRFDQNALNGSLVDTRKIRSVPVYKITINKSFTTFPHPLTVRIFQFWHCLCIGNKLSVRNLSPQISTWYIYWLINISCTQHNFNHFQYAVFLGGQYVSVTVLYFQIFYECNILYSDLLHIMCTRICGMHLHLSIYS